eukprot:SAG11_NODE_544_length_8629_cov_3.550229_6_plen_78_part_00
MQELVQSRTGVDFRRLGARDEAAHAALVALCANGVRVEKAAKLLSRCESVGGVMNVLFEELVRCVSRYESSLCIQQP